MLATIAHLQGTTDAAAATYRKALAIDPHASVAANNLAWLYAERGGNLDVALQLAQTAKRDMPQQPEVNDTLGWIYYKKNLPQIAVSALQDSVAAAPGNATFQYHLGLTYARLGDKVKARAALERALQLDAQFDGAADARRVLAGLEG
jgi:Flp pilus assembly protein TadD